MSQESTLSQPPKNVSLIPFFVVGLVLLLLFWLVTKALVWFSPEVPDAEAIRYDERAAIYVRVMEQADKDLNEYSWRDEAAGRVQIPVERAMQLVANELAANPGIQPANFIDPLRAAAEEGSMVTPQPAPTEDAPATSEEPSAADSAAIPDSSPSLETESSAEAVPNE